MVTSRVGRSLAIAAALQATAGLAGCREYNVGQIGSEFPGSRGGGAVPAVPVDDRIDSLIVNGGEIVLRAPGRLETRAPVPLQLESDDGYYAFFVRATSPAANAHLRHARLQLTGPGIALEPSLNRYADGFTFGYAPRASVLAELTVRSDREGAAGDYELLVIRNPPTAVIPAARLSVEALSAILEPRWRFRQRDEVSVDRAVGALDGQPAVLPLAPGRCYLLRLRLALGAELDFQPSVPRPPIVVTGDHGETRLTAWAERDGFRAAVCRAEGAETASVAISLAAPGPADAPTKRAGRGPFVVFAHGVPPGLRRAQSLP